MACVWFWFGSLAFKYSKCILSIENDISSFAYFCSNGNIYMDYIYSHTRRGTGNGLDLNDNKNSVFYVQNYYGKISCIVNSLCIKKNLYWCRRAINNSSYAFHITQMCFFPKWKANLIWSYLRRNNRKQIAYSLHTHTHHWSKVICVVSINRMVALLIGIYVAYIAMNVLLCFSSVIWPMKIVNCWEKTNRISQILR